MMPTAVSQVTESVVKLFCGLYLSYRCIEKASAEYVSYGTVFGIAAEDTLAAMSIAAPYAASAAIAGVAVSTGVGCLVMMTFFLFSEKTNSIYRKAEITVFEAAFLLIKMAVPVCAGALVINMASLVDLFSVMNRINSAVKSNWPEICKSIPELLTAE